MDMHNANMIDAATHPIFLIRCCSIIFTILLYIVTFTTDQLHSCNVWTHGQTPSHVLVFT